jgi:hypothetical protein
MWKSFCFFHVFSLMARSFLDVISFAGNIQEYVKQMVPFRFWFWSVSLARLGGRGRFAGHNQPTFTRGSAVPAAEPAQRGKNNKAPEGRWFEYGPCKFSVSFFP